MTPIIFALGVVIGIILLIIFTEVLEKPVLDEIKRVKFGYDSPKKLPKPWVQSFHTTLLIFSYLLGQLFAYIALALL
jgi:energy-converting hydrogenase Eha subunit A